MKEFVSRNGLNMVECELYNWQKANVYQDKPKPIVYVIHMGGLAEMYQALWNPKTELLGLCSMAYSSDETFRFYCPTLWDAEVIVAAFIKANNFDMNETIYEKI
jgi:hypothetical protein